MGRKRKRIDTLATGELDALAQLPMADEQKSRVRELQAVIEGRAKRWRTIVSGTIGLNGSDNANSYPSSGLLEFKLTPGAATATSTYESFGGAQKTIREVASTASVTAAATYEIANQDRDSITVGPAVEHPFDLPLTCFVQLTPDHLPLATCCLLLATCYL